MDPSDQTMRSTIWYDILALQFSLSTFVLQMAGLHIFGDMNFTFVAGKYVYQDQ